MWDDLRVSQLMTDLLSRGGASIVGVLLLIATTTSLMRTVVIPRALRSAISDAVARTVVGICIGISRLRRTYRGRDSVLAWAGPSTIILQLLTWLLLYLLAFGLLIYGMSGGPLGSAMRQSGSSLLTLGFAAGDREGQTIIDFFAAATGPIVIALLIGFLPTIYSAYLEREVDVSLVSATGGEPTWGPELLSRAVISGTFESLPAIFAEWGHWAARLRLTHVTYPVLVWVRSARASRHYVVALLAMMDAAALKIALTRTLPRTEAFGLLLQGGQTFEVLYISLFARHGWRNRLPFIGQFRGGSPEITAEVARLPTWNRGLLAIEQASDADAMMGLDRSAAYALRRGEQHQLNITRAEFDVAVDLLQRSGFPIENDLDLAWEEFRVSRSRYEFAAYEICRRLDAVPAPWSGDRRRPTATMWPTLAVDMLAEDDE